MAYGFVSPFVILLAWVKTLKWFGQKREEEIIDVKAGRRLLEIRFFIHDMRAEAPIHQLMAIYEAALKNDRHGERHLVELKKAKRFVDISRTRYEQGIKSHNTTKENVILGLSYIESVRRFIAMAFSISKEDNDRVREVVPHLAIFGDVTPDRCSVDSQLIEAWHRCTHRGYSVVGSQDQVTRVA